MGGNLASKFTEISFVSCEVTDRIFLLKMGQKKHCEQGQDNIKEFLFKSLVFRERWAVKN